MRVGFHSCTSQQLQPALTAGGWNVKPEYSSMQELGADNGGHIPFGYAQTLLQAWPISLGLILPFLQRD